MAGEIGYTYVGMFIGSFFAFLINFKKGRVYMNYQKVARKIVENVGGNENIKSVTHCFTRLRFVLKDDKKANKDFIQQLEGVISVVLANGQFQVVCGAKVPNIYEEVIKLVDNEQKQSHSDKIDVHTFIRKISEIFTPLVPAIAASGLIKGLLSAAAKIPMFSGFTSSSTYTILNTASNVIFFFIPIFLAYTTAKALKCSPIIAMVIGAFICHPVIDALVQDVDKASTIFGLPVIKQAFMIGEAKKVFSYTESVIPIILSICILAIIEKYLKKIIPNILQVILVPGISLLIMIPIILVIVGPIGIYVGFIIQWVYQSIYSLSPLLGGAIIGALWGVFVIFGAHRALLPIGLNDVALTGTNTLMCFAGAANFSQAGASFGVMLKSKNAETKQVAGAGALSAFLVGVTEPAIYGCNLRLKKPMICAIISGGIGGAVMGFGHALNSGFANNGVLTIMSYYGEGTSLFQFVAYIIGISISFFLAAILTYILGFDEPESNKTKKVGKILSRDDADICLTSPVIGDSISLDKVNDEVFASGALGQGIAIYPNKGEVISPYDGVVSVLYPTLHVVGLTLDNGVEVFIHIGIDTVNLNGKCFDSYVKQGDHIKKGEVLIKFDAEQISKLGYDPTVIFAIANSNQYKNINGIEKRRVDYNSEVVLIKK